MLLYCVTTVRYSIQVNGVGVGSVYPTRGIRQGDPLSPYLFIICSEGLSVLLQQAEGCGDIHGIRIAWGAPAVTHLFFADDSLLFFRATNGEAQSVKKCLDRYSVASGQLVNYDKSSIIFSSNTGTEVRIVVSECLGVRETVDFGKYLGLPSVLGRNKTATFRYIEDKVRERLGSWQHRLLSKAGRLCDKIEKLFNRYWWGGDPSDATLHTPPVDALREASVNGLMNAHGHWDVDILNELFVEDDVRKIIATPIAPHLPGSWRWVGDIHGAYSVKHGYRMLTSGGALQIPGESVIWNKIWSLPIPPKVRNLIWRCARDILPVRENLKAKGVWIGGGCPLCGLYSKTAEHLLGECWIARQVWGKDDLLQGAAIRDFLDTTLANADRDTAVHMAADTYKPSISTVQRVDVQVRWEPPPRHWFKCNVDAALLTNFVGFGAVLRDHGGGFVAAKNGRLDCIRDPLMAEAGTVKEALSWLRGLGYSSLIIETDCLLFSNAFNSSPVDFSYVDYIVKQCVEIANDIGNVVVHHVKRSANHVAHALAQATDSSTDSSVWSIVPPVCISSFLIE
ncbi:PREDICTED: uncharacterized protein LOC109173362 [Ipomoea nil]|uniref:uncharacterized protein LOC109173362 n=1 Tax=Ipomoea nil TaxID=35883 RepID=UPI000900CFB1|nr:PREDICTED: uncharacterized protein LOC109173362 [Ipomoea nil]